MKETFKEIVSDCFIILYLKILRIVDKIVLKFRTQILQASMNIYS